MPRSFLAAANGDTMTLQDRHSAASHGPPAPFIVGVGRSGTTLLRLMLDAHPELAIPSETHFLPTLLAEAAGADRALFFRTLTGSETWPNMALGTEELEQALDAVEPFSPAEGLRAFYRLYARRLGKTRWGDKSPPYRRHMATIQRALPEAHFVHMIRDGRDVALSYRGLWFGPGDDIEAQARFWVDEIGRARRQATDLRHYAELRYEDLVADPEASLRRLCQDLDLAFDPAMLAYHRASAERLAETKSAFGPAGSTPRDLDAFLAIHERVSRPPDAGRIGRWRSEMPPEQQRLYEAIAGPLLAELGYETRFRTA